jgi:hypothetical protein
MNLKFIKLTKIKFCFYYYHGSTERTCYICGKTQINIREIVYNGLKNNWKDTS